MQKITFLIMFLLSTTLYAQNESELSNKNNSKDAGIYLLYTSLDNHQNKNNLGGWGFILNDNINSKFFEVEFLFPIKNNDPDFVTAFNVYAGMPIASLKFAKKLEISLNAEIGLSNFVIKDSLKKDQLYTGFNGLVGINLRFYGFFLNSKIGPIFTTGAYKFNSLNISIGYIF
jgi:hypothetical protein